MSRLTAMQTVVAADRVMDAVADAVEDMRADFPDVGDADLYHDAVISQILDQPREVVLAVGRRTGYDLSIYAG